MSTSEQNPSDDMRFSLTKIGFSLFGFLFEGRRTTFESLNRALKQARNPLDYDAYLARSALISLLFGLLGATLGVILSITLAEIILSLSAGITIPPAILETLRTDSLYFRGFIITSIISIVLAASSFVVQYYYPYYVAGERGRKIDLNLPYAITYCYAMSRGGVSIFDVINSLADSDDAYGEVTVEFDAIRNNVLYAKEDLREAVRKEANITPSENLKSFLEDLISVIDSGSDFESYFYNKSQLYSERRKKKQAETLEFLDLMSEIYVTLFVASPIFALVVLLVMSLLGGVPILILYAVSYAILPIGAIAFVLLIKIIGSANSSGDITLDRVDWAVEPRPTLEEEAKEDPRFSEFKKVQKQTALKKAILAPIKQIRFQPAYSLIFTAPLVSLAVLAAYQSGVPIPTLDGLIDDPITITLGYFLVPFYIVAIPWMILYELRKRQKKKILQALPEVFKGAADANSRGIQLTRCLELVSETSASVLSNEFRDVVNQARWTGNIGDSLSGMANKLAVPRLTRTVKMIDKANDTSSDIQSVLQVAAVDVEESYKIDKARVQNAQMYLAIISVSYLIALGVIVTLDVSFLSVFESEDFASEGGAPGLGTGGVSEGVPVDTFRLLFFHVTLILGITSGFVAGAMSNGDATNGLKVSVIFSIITLATFALL